MHQDNKMLRVTGLWNHHSKGAGDYLAGNLNSRVRIVIFSNRHKENESSPDYYLYLAPVVEQTKDKDVDKSVPGILDNALPVDFTNFIEDVACTMDPNEDIPF